MEAHGTSRVARRTAEASAASNVNGATVAAGSRVRRGTLAACNDYWAACFGGLASAASDEAERAASAELRVADSHGDVARARLHRVAGAQSERAGAAASTCAASHRDVTADPGHARVTAGNEHGA